MSSDGGTGADTRPLVAWKRDADEHDYPAAASYLSLLADAEKVNHIVGRLKAAPVSTFKAKDILRASRLPLLELDNVHVKRDLAKVIQGKALSPVLIVRGDASRDVAMTVADGYHRVCVSYHIDENTDIPCQIADL